MTLIFDGWALEPAEPPTPSAKYRSTLVARAKKRVGHIEAVGDGAWVVSGDHKLGDGLRAYAVTLKPGERKYDCDCYYSQHGDSRRRKMCSHVMGVILFRQQTRGHEIRRDRQPIEGGGQQNTSGTHTNNEPTDHAATVAVVKQFGNERGEVQPPSTVSLPSLPETIPGVDDLRFGTPKLPDKITEIRPHQWHAVEEVLEAYKAGASVVWLDGPTGTGKTLIAELVRRCLKEKAIYVCSSKTLQDQFAADFTYAKVLKGRSNYPTDLMPWPGYSTADCMGAGCLWCPALDECAYNIAKSQALSAPLACTNTSYLLTVTNYVGDFKGRDLVVVDECDVLERELMGFVEFSVTDGALKGLDNLEPPKKGSHKETIVEWLTGDLYTMLIRHVNQIPSGTTDVRMVRRLKALQNLYMKSQQLAGELSEYEENRGDNWIRDNDAGPMVMKPISVAPYGQENLWQHGKKWLAMSATIISPEELSDSLGLGDAKTATVRVPMTFPVENRRIFVAPVADMAQKGRDVEWPKMAKAIGNILVLHPNERVLVHTVSYELAAYLQGELRSPRTVTYRSSSEREEALRTFRARPGSVLLAPSFDRGIDLRGDECRVVVVAKIPFPYLGDKQVGARLRTQGGQAWYTVQTIRTLVQMTGRGVRSADDWCVTYVLDRQFVKNIWKKHRHLLPEWWKEAIDMHFPVRELL